MFKIWEELQKLPPVKQFEAQPLKIRSLNGGKSLDDIKPGDRILVPAN